MDRQAISLSQLLGMVKEAVGLLFEDGLWMTAELLRISGSHHLSLELVEYDDNRKEVAKTSGKIWGSNASIVKKFKKSTGQDLGPGMKILMRARPMYHEIYGMSLHIQDIDPNYTLGDMEARLNQIRSDLKEKGWWGLNKSLVSPKDFSRLAVISPADAAGLGDFKVEANKLESAGVCIFEYFPALFQGDRSADQIVDQMVKVLEIHNEKPFDALILIRGGGDKAGLYHLNNRRLAASICKIPLPVMVGIGHERDKVILDEVSNMTFSTPSLLISHIRNTIVDNAQLAWNNYQKLTYLAQQAVDKALNECDQMLSLLETGSLRQIDQAVSNLEGFKTKLNHNSETIIQKADIKLGSTYQNFEKKSLNSLDSFSDELILHRDRLVRQAETSLLTAEQSIEKNVGMVMSSNPISILGKGYSYVKKEDIFIKNANQLKSGDSIMITLQSGQALAKVEDTHNEK